MNVELRVRKRFPNAVQQIQSWPRKREPNQTQRDAARVSYERRRARCMYENLRLLADEYPDLPDVQAPGANSGTLIWEAHGHRLRRRCFGEFGMGYWVYQLLGFQDYEVSTTNGPYPDSPWLAGRIRDTLRAISGEPPSPLTELSTRFPAVVHLLSHVLRAGCFTANDMLRAEYVLSVLAERFPGLPRPRPLWSPAPNSRLSFTWDRGSDKISVIMFPDSWLCHLSRKSGEYHWESRFDADPHNDTRPPDNLIQALEPFA